MVPLPQRAGYPSDLTDEQWAVLEPLVGGACCSPAKVPPSNLRRTVLSDLLILRGVRAHIRSDNVLCREAAGHVLPQVSIGSLG